ncbi:MAG: winged helix-turn-helix domain-containing protein [Saprospiraceae bacterium]
MPSIRFAKYLPLLLTLPLMAWLLGAASDNGAPEQPDRINLALRRTADGLLRASGDSTSRIPAVAPVGEGVWRVYLAQAFDYEQLPPLLQSSLDLYGVRQSYRVAVRKCYDATLDLGYHQQDYLQNGAVPCGGRTMPEGCHYIEIAFDEGNGSPALWTAKSGLLLLVLGGLAGGFWLLHRKKMPPAAATETEQEWLPFGHSRLDANGQVLECGGIREQLTFRETKLLRLFVTHPDQVLERDFILKEVWADEGVLVGRSVDMFVSRLRKKLSADPSVGIAAVHGVGYRLETGKE